MTNGGYQRTVCYSFSLSCVSNCLLVSFIQDYKRRAFPLSLCSHNQQTNCRQLYSYSFIHSTDTKAGPLSQRDVKSTPCCFLSSTSSLKPLPFLSTTRTTLKPIPNHEFYIVAISISKATMHFHSIIVAALSAGALSVSLTAKDLTDSDNQPNTKCTGENNGESTFEIGLLLILTKLWAAQHHV